MKKIPTRLVVASAILLLTVTFQFTGCSSNSDDPNKPKIISIDPESGPLGTLVQITGQGFGATSADNVVKFNGVEADVQNGGPTLLIVVAPKSKTGPITVTFGTTTLNGPTFTYTAPVVTEPYFFKFKADGDDVAFQTSNPGYQGCGQCSCADIPPLAGGDFAGMSVCFSENGSVSASMIQSLKGKTLTFDDSKYPYVTFNTTIAGVGHGTYDVTQPASSKITVTDVVDDGSYFGLKALKVSGTITCKVEDDKHNAVNITEGTFSVRFTEGF